MASLALSDSTDDSDLRNQGMSAEATPEMYVPFVQQPETTAAGRPWFRRESLFVLRVGWSSDDQGAMVRSAVAEVNPGLAVSELGTMQDRLDVAAKEILVGLFFNGPIIVLALALTAVGIYGVLS